MGGGNSGLAGTPNGGQAGLGGSGLAGGLGGLGLGGGTGLAGTGILGGGGGSSAPGSSPVDGGGWNGGGPGGSGGSSSGCAGGGGGGGWYGGGGGGATNCTGGGGGGGGGSSYVCPCASGGSSSTGFRPGNGLITVSWRVPTTLTTSPATVSASGQAVNVYGLTATLTGPGGPLAGQAVTFTAGSAHLCAATTNAAGVATCNARITGNATRELARLMSLGYTATYAGDPCYQGSTATGTLIGGSCECMAGASPAGPAQADAYRVASWQDRDRAVL
jgi:hypothetical protein